VKKSAGMADFGRAFAGRELFPAIMPWPEGKKPWEKR